MKQGSLDADLGGDSRLQFFNHFKGAANNEHLFITQLAHETNKPVNAWVFLHLIILIKGIHGNFALRKPAEICPAVTE